MRRLLVLLTGPCFSSCWILSDSAQPTVDLGLHAATQYNFRGMVNNETGVVQTDLGISMPTAWEGGELRMGAWTNWDVRNDTGDSWFPDGHGGEPSEIDLSLHYTETYRGIDFVSGFESYALQNPDDFPSASERGETKEIFVQAGTLIWWDLYPALRVHYDIDEVEGLYINSSLSRSFDLGEAMSVDTELALGYSGSNASDWSYGVNSSGLADLRASGVFHYFLGNADITASLNFATIVDDDIADWFDVIGIETENVWLAVGATWTY